jgi:hypothetical protein
METKAEGFYWDDTDRNDQEVRRKVNEGLVYTEQARCDSCGAQGAPYQCGVCKAVLCTSCICGDGFCPNCTGSGKEAIPEE